MIRRPPRYTRTDTLFPYTTLFRSIVDKFIGDAVMAMWGAIKRDEDHAVHACAAVRAIGMAMAADNARRLMLGKPILRMRVGIHSGPVVIGNIGAPGRINFTVVGDTVNTAQRLEQLGHDHMNDIDQFIALARSEERRVGKKCVSTCRSRWSPFP